MRSYEFVRISHLVKYVRIAVSLDWVRLRLGFVLGLLACNYAFIFIKIVSTKNYLIVKIFLYSMIVNEVRNNTEPH